MSHVGAQKEQQDVEVVQRAAEPTAVEDVEGGEDLVDGEEGGVPNEEPNQAEEDNRSQQDVDGTVCHAYHLKHQLANHFALNQFRNPGLITQHARADEAAELVLQEGRQVEVGQVETGGCYEGQEEEAPQEKHADEEIGVLLDLHVSFQKRVLKVSLLLSPAIEEGNRKSAPCSPPCSSIPAGSVPTPFIYFWQLGAANKITSEYPLGNMYHERILGICYCNDPIPLGIKFNVLKLLKTWM